jgi:ferric enterobactin receptor
MKSTFSLPFLVLCLLTTAVNAQKINGLVQESNGEAASYATITLHKSADSMLVKGAITGDDGAFEILGAGAGTYFLKANLIGYRRDLYPNI